jgi:hypothetical protein
MASDNHHWWGRGWLQLQAQQDDVAPAVEEEAPPPSSDSFGYDDDARPGDKVRRPH